MHTGGDKTVLFNDEAGSYSVLFPITAVMGNNDDGFLGAFGKGNNVGNLSRGWRFALRRRESIRDQQQHPTDNEKLRCGAHCP